MTPAELLKFRLSNQHISKQVFDDPHDIVKWLGAVQAQDYAASKWALGLRLKDNTDNDIDRALADGRIIRTHIMRPTWHLVSPDHIRWLLQLTAPRIKQICSYQYQHMELDEKVLAKSAKVLAKALEGGRHLSRTEIAAALNKAKIPTNELRLIHIMMRAELDAVVCSGPRVGKQFTYALFDERVPQAKPLKRDEALARLGRCYFTGHGPATAKDFAWWSGLTVADAKRCIEILGPWLEEVKVLGDSLWVSRDVPIARSQPGVHLLPAFDEYLVGYADRGAALDEINYKSVATINGIFYPVILVNGKVAGTWKREVSKNGVEVELEPFNPLSPSKEKAIKTVLRKYGKFMDLPVLS